MGCYGQFNKHRVGISRKRTLNRSRYVILIQLIMGKTGQSGQGNAGGWPSTTGGKSGGGRSNKSPGVGKSGGGSKGGGKK